MTKLTTWAAVPPPTPELTKSLSPQQRTDHRAAIATEVLTVLGFYYQPKEIEAIKAAQLATWCDMLEDWTREQVVWALRKWNLDQPDKRPTPGHILRIMKQKRGERFAQERRDAEAKAADAPREPRVSGEQATEICREHGFLTGQPGYTPKKFWE